MDHPNYLSEPQPGFYERNRNLIKGFFVSALILVLMIPTFFISNLIDERKERNEEVKRSIANQWSQSQTIIGPILVIPFTEASMDDQRKTTARKQHLYIMPDKLNIKAKLLPEIKQRSIFKVPIYNSNLDISGTFAPLDLKELSIPSQNLILQEAKLVFAVRDSKGLQEETHLSWDSSAKNLHVGDDFGVNGNGDSNPNAGYELINNPNQALSTELPLDLSSLEQTHSFSMKLNLRGSEKLFFTPVGNTTKVQVNAQWKDRDFQGNYLPDTHSLSDTGFVANWNIYRGVPPKQMYKLGDINRSTFGVNLIQPLDSYAKTTRTIKYAILVIMLTFVVYFFIELFQKRYVNAMQYVLIGFALCLFYTLVLSISEYLGFESAYMISALSTLLLIAIYTRSVFGSTKTAWVFGGFLSLLYTFIFILIQLEDGALLVGSIGLFIILAAIMYVSRKLDWNK